MPDLSAADIAEGRRLIVAQPSDAFATHEWARNHLPALLDAAEKAARLEAAVADFINQRVEYVNSCRNANADHDYYRWQGGAEARRQLAERLGWTTPYEFGEKTVPKVEAGDA